MCTAISYTGKGHYFGRNLDLERSYGEKVVITPRNYPFHFRNRKTLNNHYAMIGMAAVVDGYPLYFEATNEKGLSIAGLNFPDNAVYHSKAESRDNISPFELIPWILGQCSDLEQAKRMLNRMNLWDEPFNNSLPLSPLHFLIADKKESITVESTINGLQVFDNPVGVLTNSPGFDYHIINLSNYMNLTAGIPENRLSDKIKLSPYSLGMGAFGLPGDPSSASRFVKAAFTKLNSLQPETEEESISQFFHILSSVAQQKGITMVTDGKFEYTMYSCCCNTDKGIYYFTTYGNSRICAIDLHQEDLNSEQLITYTKPENQDILYLNNKC